MCEQKNASLLVDASEFKSTPSAKGFFVNSQYSNQWVDAGKKKNLDFQEGVYYEFIVLNKTIPIYLPDGEIVDSVQITHSRIANKAIYLVMGWVSLFAEAARVYETYPETLEETIKKYQPPKPKEN